ncbi:MAG: sugar ABC transporter substrate-binding protein [Spirochaetota bacterium]
MQRKWLGMFVVLLIMVVPFTMVFGAKKEAEKEKPVSEMEIGYVVPYEIGWYKYYIQGFELVCEKNGVETVRLHNQYKPKMELDAVQDLITRGVDAINVTSPTPESAQHVCQLANEAGIPIQVTETTVAEGPGEAFARIDFDWYEINKVLIDKLREDVQGEIKIAYIAGMAGSAPVELMIQGMKAGIKEYDDVSLVSLRYGDYKIDKSLNIMQDWLQAGLDFNVVIGACQEITEGAIQAINQSGVDPDSIVVVSTNGGPMDTQNIKDGEIDFCMSYSPGINGAIYARNMIAYLKGEKYQELAYGPYVWTSQDNYLEKYIPWNVDESWLPVVEQFVKTGEYDRSIQR